MSQSTQTPGWGPPTTPPPPKRKRRIPIIGWIGIALAIFVVWGVIATNGDDTSDTSTATQTPEVTSAAIQVETPATTAAPQPEADASTQLSCGHFRNVMGDIGNGLLTDSEIREKTKQFYDTGQRSDIPKIRLSTQRMLAAITTGDTDAYIAAAKSMSATCRTVGQ